MALYEITFLTKEETDPGVKALIEQAGGQVTEESSLGRRRLTYPIQRLDQAVYTTFTFDFEKPALPELNRKLSLNKELLRYLITIKPIAQKVDKEMSKTVREAIAAAEKLEDTPADMKAETAVSQVETVDIELPTEEIVETIESTEESIEEKKPRVKNPPAGGDKPAADAAEATEEDRLKALEDKLSDILKD